MTSSVTSSNPYAFLNGSSNSSSTASASSSASSSTASSATSGKSAEAIQNQFLTLLVAQLKAQDPSNPVDNAQITSQMAQISQVTGIQQMNGTLQSLLAAQSANQSMAAANMIGGKVLVPGNAMTLSGNGGSVNAAVKLSGAADSMVIDIRDKNGQIVDSMTVKNASAGMNNFNWDGKDSNGNALPAGNYTFSVKAANASGQGGVTATPYANQTVTAVNWATGATQLILQNGQSVPLSSVSQLSA